MFPLIRNGLALIPLCYCILDAQQVSADQLRARFHVHVGEILQNAGISIPSGDTLVSWANQGPILYHTIAVDSNGVKSSMIRNDPFVGVLKTVWVRGTACQLRGNLA